MVHEDNLVGEVGCSRATACKMLQTNESVAVPSKFPRERSTNRLQIPQAALIFRRLGTFKTPPFFPAILATKESTVSTVVGLIVPSDSCFLSSAFALAGRKAELFAAAYSMG